MLVENANQKCSEIDPFTIERYMQFLKFIHAGYVVLDIGCNTGRGGIVLKQNIKNLELHGVDLIEERVRKINQGVYDSIQICSVEEADFPNEFFNAIVAGEIIEHIPKNLFDSVLDKCFKILKPGGVLVLTTPNPKSFLVQLGRRQVFMEPSHVNILSVDELKRITNQHNFKVVSIKGSGKATRYVGETFPLMGVYGSYLMVLKKGI